MNLKLDLQSDTLTPDLQRRIDALTPERRTRLNLALAQAVANFARRAIREPALRPVPWDALSAKTLLARLKRKPKRIGTAALIASGTLARSPRVESADPEGASVASDRAAGEYSLAAIHQYGAPKRKIPARPFFPFRGGPFDTPIPTVALDAEILRIIRRHVEGK